MDAYTSFAAVYDTFMDNIPYKMESLFGNVNIITYRMVLCWILVWDRDHDRTSGSRRV